MTEELEKKAYEYSIKEIPFIECISQNDLERLVQQAYIAGAEPREKQIQIDAEQIRALQKQNGELTDKVKELEAQIEKMKCCENCTHKYCSECKGKNVLSDVDYWELDD